MFTFQKPIKNYSTKHLKEVLSVKTYTLKRWQENMQFNVFHSCQCWRGGGVGSDYENNDYLRIMKLNKEVVYKALWKPIYN